MRTNYILLGEEDDSGDWANKMFGDGSRQRQLVRQETQGRGGIGYPLFISTFLPGKQYTIVSLTHALDPQGRHPKEIDRLLSMAVYEGCLCASKRPGKMTIYSRREGKEILN